MRSIFLPTRTLLVLLALSAFASIALAQNVGLGDPYPATSEVSDQKAGSILIYNYYTSSSSNTTLTNTRINITNINQTTSVAVHLFFVDGTTCSPADAFICLTPNGTATFIASDIDPDVTGYIVMVATSSTTGCPINFNFLVGDEYIKIMAPGGVGGLGHQANLGAEAFAALYGDGVGTDVGDPLPFCDAASVTATLSFDGTTGLTGGYNKLPRTLALDHFSNQSDDGNNTILILNRIGGNLLSSSLPIGPLFALFYDDAEQPFSVSFNGPNCQLVARLSDRTVFRTLGGGVNNIVPAGRSGWIRFYSPTTPNPNVTPPILEVALLGAAINFNPGAAQSASLYNGGHNLHKLTLTSTAITLTIPVFPPFC